MTCYLSLSRRLELVVARAAGVSAWQFIAPALWSALELGVFATLVYNPLSAHMQERAKQMEAEMFGEHASGIQDANGFWINQVSPEGQVDHQCRAQPAAGRGAQRDHRVPVRHRLPVQGPDRGARSGARAGPLAVAKCPALQP